VVSVDDAERVVDGLILVGALLAAEGGLHESYLDADLSVVIITAIYWLARAYADVLAGRLQARHRLTPSALWRGLAKEAPLMRGATVPLIVLIVSAATGVNLADAVTAAVWSTVATLVSYELLAALRTPGTLAERALELVVGVTIGLGIVLLKVVLH
jgi:hypothetical protein